MIILKFRQVRLLWYLERENHAQFGVTLCHSDILKNYICPIFGEAVKTNQYPTPDFILSSSYMELFRNITSYEVRRKQWRLTDFSIMFLFTLSDNLHSKLSLM